MDALEKGKNSARTGAGGKVSSQMPAAPQFVAKKPNADQKPSEADSHNPFVGQGGISFKLATESTFREAGVHRAAWDGRDHSGRPVADGVYFLRLRAQGKVLTTKAVKLR